MEDRDERRVIRGPVGVGLCALLIPGLQAQPAHADATATLSDAADRAIPYRPSMENLAAREWFQDARFGVFVHWDP